MDESAVSQPQTCRQLGWTLVDWTSQTLVLLHTCTTQQNLLNLNLTMGTAVAGVNTLVRQSVTPVAQPQRCVPATEGDCHCLTTVAVANVWFQKQCVEINYEKKYQEDIRKICI
jgi:hypothetical protein